MNMYTIYTVRFNKNKNKMECPICFMNDRGAFLLTNCGHHVCPQCLVTMKDSSAVNAFKCPLCRTNITSKPVIVQAFADCIQNGTVRQMKDLVDSWFSTYVPYINRVVLPPPPPRSRSPLSHTHAPPPIRTEQQFGDILRIAAEREYTASIPVEHPVKQWNSDLAGFPIGSHYEPEIKFRRFDMGDGWQLYPFTNGPVTITNFMTCVERDTSLLELERPHRRITIIAGEKLAELVTNLEGVAQNFINGTGGLRLQSELNMRSVPWTDQGILSICAHSGTWSNPNTVANKTYTKLMTLACRGIWVRHNLFGCRWHIF